MSPTQSVVYLSPEGMDKARAELRRLIEVDRPEAIELISAAKQLGDISESGDYETARDRQAFVEGRISTLEAMVKEAVIIRTPVRHDQVAIGATVTLTEGDASESYQIVGSAEARPADGRISNESPLGQALLGRRVGDEVVVTAPGGQFAYRVTAIS